MTAIPAELRERPKWVVWKHEINAEGKPIKPPYRVDGYGRASSTDPDTWATYDQAVRAAENGFDGIGYAVTEDDPYTFVDLDGVIADGGIHPSAQKIVQELDSYTERSQSGRGLHVIVRAKLNGGRNRTGRTPWRDEFETYDRARFAYLTGEVHDGRNAIEDRQHQHQEIHKILFPPTKARTAAAPGAGFAGSDAELLDKAFSAGNGTKVQDLYGGGLAGLGSRSEADLALCSALAFWTGPDPGRLDRLFRGSRLMRDKWDRQDYRESTLAKALDRAEFYDPAGLTRASESVESVANPRDQDGVTDSLTPPYRSQRVSESVPESVVSDSDIPESVESVPFARPLEEFVAERSASPPALLGDEDEILLPAAGLMLIVAKGGKGKTTMVIEQALHLAAGQDWLGFTVPHPLRVLFIENEGPREPFRAKLESKLENWKHDLAGDLFVHTHDWGGFTLADVGAHNALRAFIEEHHIDVVIGDPLDSLGMTGVGSPEDVRGLMALMHRVGLHQDVAFVLLHHPHKGEASDPLDEASGAWGGKPDTQLNLEKTSGNRARLSFPKVRWSRRGARPAYLLAFDPDSESFSVVHEEPEEERDHDAEIESLLGDGAWRTPKEISMPADKGGIGANVDLVKERLGKRPDLFVSRTGDEAREVGRSPRATVWQLLEPTTDEELQAKFVDDGGSA